MMAVMIDLLAVRSLVAVEAEGSVHAAATALGYTPSAVSQQVKRLERQLDVALLERVGRGVVLTAAGRDLVAGADRVHAELEQLEASLRRRSDTVTGRLRLAAFSTANRGLVAPVLADLAHRHPALEVAISEHEPWDTVELVSAGRVDVGLAHSWGDLPLTVPDHVVATEVARDVAEVLVRDDHPLAGATAVTPHDLVDVAWVATPEGTICRQWLSRMYVGTGAAPRIAHTCLEFDSHLALVAAGLGVALVPRLGRSALPAGVVAVRVHDPVPERTVTALHRRTMDDSPAVRVLVESLSGWQPPAAP